MLLRRLVIPSDPVLSELSSVIIIEQLDFNKSLGMECSSKIFKVSSFMLIAACYSYRRNSLQPIVGCRTVQSLAIQLAASALHEIFVCSSVVIPVASATDIPLAMTEATSFLNLLFDPSHSFLMLRLTVVGRGKKSFKMTLPRHLWPMPMRIWTSLWHP